MKNVKCETWKKYFKYIRKRNVRQKVENYLFLRKCVGTLKRWRIIPETSVRPNNGIENSFCGCILFFSFFFYGRGDDIDRRNHPISFYVLCEISCIDFGVLWSNSKYVGVYKVSQYVITYGGLFFIISFDVVILHKTYSNWCTSIGCSVLQLFRK